VRKAPVNAECLENSQEASLRLQSPFFLANERADVLAMKARMEGAVGEIAGAIAEKFSTRWA
jgi:hypothetical protein